MSLSPTVDEIAACLAPLPPFPNREEGVRPAAVMVPLFSAEGQWRVLFIRRSQQVAVHRGQIAFPGGCWEPEDPDYLATALRELEEELGLDSRRVNVLGGLSPCLTATTRFIIHPFVGVLPDLVGLRPDASEVAEVRSWPLAHFLGFREGEPFYVMDEATTIWGATARVLHELASRLQPVWKP